MFEIFQEILLSRWVVGFMLLCAFLVITRWSLVQLKEYPGYALGVLMGLFFIMVYIALGGGAEKPQFDSEGVEIVRRSTLNIFEVFVATFFGLISGAGIMLALRIGSGFTRGIALQVAFYSALNIILLFLAFIAGPITQRMIGIFGLAIGIATLFSLVLFPQSTRPMQANAMNAQSLGGNNPQVPPPQPGENLGGGGSRLDEIRQRMRQKDQQR
jgi:hypothetical protein